MRVIRTTIKGGTEKFKDLTVEQATAELLVSHPTSTSKKVEKTLLKGVRMQGLQGSFYQLNGGYQGDEGQYKDSESKQKRKKKGMVVKPEDTDIICTPEGLAKRLNTTAFSVRKAVRSLKLERKGKYWAWNKIEDAETINAIIAKLKEPPKPKPVAKAKVDAKEPLMPHQVEEEEEEDEEEEEE